MLNLPIDVVSVTSAHNAAYSPDNSDLANSNIITFPPLQLSVHAHTFYTLLYFTKCEEPALYSNDILSTVKENHIYMIPPHTPHLPSNRISASRAGVSIKFYLSDRYLSDKIGTTPFSAPCDSSLKKQIETILSLIDSSFNKLELNELVHNLLLSILSTKELERTSHQPSDLPGTDFLKLIRYLYENCANPISLSDMAKVMYMERIHFAKKFKSAFGITPANYLSSLRLNISLELLIHSNLPIAKVAEKVGFQSVGAFCTAFSRSFNTTPSKYRKLAQKKEKQFHHRLK